MLTYLFPANMNVFVDNIMLYMLLDHTPEITRGKFHFGNANEHPLATSSEDPQGK